MVQYSKFLLGGSNFRSFINLYTVFMKLSLRENSIPPKEFTVRVRVRIIERILLGSVPSLMFAE